MPATSSLLAGAKEQPKKHQVAQIKFEDQNYVRELKATLRFKGNRILTRIFLKMRTHCEDRTNLRLTEHEWPVLQGADIKLGASLE